MGSARSSPRWVVKSSGTPQARKASGFSEHLTIAVTVGSHVARVNGRDVDMGAAAGLRNRHMTIPLQFFADAAGGTLSVNRRTGIARLSITPKALARAD